MNTIMALACIAFTIGGVIYLSKRKVIDTEVQTFILALMWKCKGWVAFLTLKIAPLCLMAIALGFGMKACSYCEGVKTSSCKMTAALYTFIFCFVMQISLLLNGVREKYLDREMQLM